MADIHIHITPIGTARNPIGSVAPLDMWLCVGVGTCVVYKNGTIFWEEDTAADDFDGRPLSEIEAAAKLDPSANWQLHMSASLERSLEASRRRAVGLH